MVRHGYVVRNPVTDEVVFYSEDHRRVRTLSGRELAMANNIQDLIGPIQRELDQLHAQQAASRQQAALGSPLGGIGSGLLGLQRGNETSANWPPTITTSGTSNIDIGTEGVEHFRSPWDTNEILNCKRCKEVPYMAKRERCFFHALKEEIYQWFDSPDLVTV